MTPSEDTNNILIPAIFRDCLNLIPDLVESYFLRFFNAFDEELSGLSDEEKRKKKPKRASNKQKVGA